ncbi:MAG: uracil-DNA glycosylase family protein [Pseudomonadota bacterium]
MLELAGRISACKICVERPLNTTLPHPPRPVAVLSNSARIAICGQAPGIRVHNSGRPFTDPSGDRLRVWMGVDDEVFYDASRVAIVPMGFCFPGYDKKGGDLPPRRECKAAWHDQVFAAMPQLKLVLAVGGYAQSYHLPARQNEAGRPRNLTETVAAWQEHLVPRNDRPCPGAAVFAMPHPSWRNNAWLKRNSWFEADVLPELRKRVSECLRSE